MFPVAATTTHLPLLNSGVRESTTLIFTKHPLFPTTLMGILFAILAAVSAACVVVLTKAGLEDLDSTLAFAIQAILILLITWTVVFVQGNQTQLAGQSKRTWVFMIAAGICTTLSTIFSYRALKLADATLVVPIERMSLVVAVILSVVFLKEKMSWQAITGVVLMLVGAILVGLAKK